MKLGVTLIMILTLFATLFAGCTSDLLPRWDQTNPNATTQPPVSQGSTGIIQVHVTDAPGDVTEVNITVSEVEIHKAGDEGESGQWISLAIEEDTFNLIELQDITLFLAGAEVEAGKYTQLRMTVFEVIVKTEDGPENGYTATVPSDKLKFVRPFTLEAGSQINLIVDIDAAKSVLFPGGKKGEPNKVIFKPVVKLMIEKDEDQASEESMAIFDPISGPIGTPIAVAGSGWTDEELINSVTVGGMATTHTLLVDDDGNLSGGILVPVLDPGIQDIGITGSTSGEQTFTDAFTVIPTAFFNPINGPIATVITVTGAGWMSLDSITFDAVTVGGVTATHTLVVDVNGNLAGTIIIPVLVPGIQDIVITGSGSGEQTFTDAFTVTPTAIFTPISGPIATSITVTGAGWVTEDSIDAVTVGGATATYALTVDGDGNLTGTITVPTLGAGVHDIVITGSTSGVQTFIDAFTVTS